MVKNVLAHGQFGLAVQGGSHDLSAHPAPLVC